VLDRRKEEGGRRGRRVSVCFDDGRCGRFIYCFWRGEAGWVVLPEHERRNC
jgi:hypothetical protein